jgi:transketolase C-terminal domain/subunit
MTLRRVGVPDTYATCGSTAYLFKKYGLDSTAIAREAKELLKASTRLVR